MANISVFLDTDVLTNWLAKEIDSKTGEELWRAPHKILKKVEARELNGFTSIINLMEIIFVLRRKKKWKDEEIISTIG
jgi:predicted nucleic-acid-binding protein